MWLLALVLAASGAAAQPLVLLVQPPAWPDEAPGFDARPLASVLSAALSREVRLRVSDNALSHWQATVAAPAYQLAFDEAHFTAHRVRRHGFTALVRDAADVRFEILVRPRTLVAGPSDLSGRAVAVPAPPALAAVRLMALFPQVAQAPHIVAPDSRAEALGRLARGDVSAALVAAGARGGEAGLEVALVTDVSPGRALSVSPEVDERERTVLIRALTAIPAPAALARALRGLAVTRFEPASDAVYEDSERLLRGTWGYR